MDFLSYPFIIVYPFIREVRVFHEEETSSSSFMEGFRYFLNAQLKTLISTGLNILGLKFKLDERELFIAINAITVVQNQ